jgi:hypothetical protein
MLDSVFCCEEEERERESSFVFEYHRKEDLCNLKINVPLKGM